MGMPWVCVVPKLPTVRLMGLIVETLDPTDTYAQRRLKAVDFSLAGFAISGAKLKSVAAAVANGRIGVEVGDTGPNFAAAYTLGANRHFTLRETKSVQNDNWRSQIVHEFDPCGIRYRGHASAGRNRRGRGVSGRDDLVPSRLASDVSSPLRTRPRRSIAPRAPWRLAWTCTPPPVSG